MRSDLMIDDVPTLLEDSKSLVLESTLIDCDTDSDGGGLWMEWLTQV